MGVHCEWGPNGSQPDDEAVISQASEENAQNPADMEPDVREKILRDPVESPVLG